MTYKHTAGPWYSRPLKTMGGCLIATTPCGNVMRIATVLFCRPDREAKYITKIPEQAEANARLIAAAPDLLEAAEYLLDDMRLNNVPTNCVEKLQRAIAKAKGE